MFSSGQVSVSSTSISVREYGFWPLGSVRGSRGSRALNESTGLLLGRLCTITVYVEEEVDDCRVCEWMEVGDRQTDGKRMGHKPHIQKDTGRWWDSAAAR